MSSTQVTMVSLEELVSQIHQYRKFKELFSFKEIEPDLKSIESGANYKGYGVVRLFKCLLLQFMEDLSDRELERYIGDSNGLCSEAYICLKLDVIILFLQTRIDQMNSKD